MQPNALWMIYTYQKHLKEARALDVKTIDAHLRHVHLFANMIGERDLSELKPDDIIRFKRTLTEADGKGEQSELLAPATAVQTLNNLKAFLVWLRQQPGHKRLAADIPDYFTPPRRMKALARVSDDKHVPPPDEIREILAHMPDKTFKQRRDRAVLAFLFLTGMRDGALIGLQIKHVDLESCRVFQDPREIRTKFSKVMMTTWFPVGEDIEAIVRSWITERWNAGVDDSAPLFPSLRHPIKHKAWADTETFWKTAGPVRWLIRQATQAAGTPYFRPHAIRSTLTHVSYKYARSLEEQKAWSQNLGHEDLGTTLSHYGTIAEARQHEIVRNMRGRDTYNQTQRLMDKIESLSAQQRDAFESFIDGFDPTMKSGS